MLSLFCGSKNIHTFCYVNFLHYFLSMLLQLCGWFMKFRISTHLWAIYGGLADSTTKSMLFLFVTLLCFFSSFFSDATIHFFFFGFFTLGALNLYFFGILSFIGSFDIYMCIVWIFHMYKMNTHWFLSILRVLSYVVVVCWCSFRRMEPLDISF